MKQDVDKLMNIARASYKSDQFHSDVFLPNELCNRYYKQWIYNLANGLADKVMVAVCDDEVIGYITLSESRNNFMRVGLCAVEEKYRGNGVFTEMVNHAYQYSKITGKDGLVYGTQIDNVPVIKGLIKLGFLPVENKYVLHKVFNST